MFSFVCIVTGMDHKNIMSFKTYPDAGEWVITEVVHSYVNLTDNSTCTKLSANFQHEEIEITYDSERPYFLLRYTFSVTIRNYRRDIPVIKSIETFYLSRVEFDRGYIDYLLIHSPLLNFSCDDNDITWVTNGAFIFPRFCEIKAKLVPYNGATMCYIHTFP